MMNEDPPSTLKADPRSLDNLHDIVIPEPAPWWPPAIGWYVLGFLFAVVGLLFAGLALHRWWSRRYRRAALVELHSIRDSLADHPTVETVSAIDELLKRVALAAWPRSAVANLTGDRWLEFLRQTSASKVPVSAQVAEKVSQSSEPSGRSGGVTDSGGDWAADLRDLVYSKRKRDAFGPEQLNSLVAAAERWIRTHRIDQFRFSTAAEDHQ